MSRDEKKFWVAVLALNFLLFLPKYILETDTSSFFPFKLILETHPLAEKFKLFFTRPNADIFRFSVDLGLLLLISRLFRKKINPKGYGIFLGIYFTIILIFLLYYNIMFKLFLVQPELYNDYYLLKIGFLNLGLPIIVKSLVILFSIALLAFLLIKAMTWLVKLTQGIKFGIYSKIFLGFIGTTFTIDAINAGLVFHFDQEYQLTADLIAMNIERSMEAYKNLRKLDISKFNEKTNYDQYKLKYKPDIYLLMFESYGKILNEDSRFKTSYLQLIDQLDKTLSKNGWYSTSCLSKSPITGIGSWIGYSSVIYGFNFRNQGSYLYLLKNPEIYKYTHMISYFRKQGYHSYWLNPLEENKDIKVPWDIYTKFYTVDSWINFTDMNYKGKLYGFGPIPPDQFSLAFSEQYMEKNSNHPHVFFCITHNSHYPFDTPDTVISDWRSLAHGYESIYQDPRVVMKPNYADYLKSIRYDLEVLIQFIVNIKNKNAVFIIIGDHQPPLFTNKFSGFETPIHIVSVDSGFISGFKKYGFTSGLKLKNLNFSISHEAVYSMLLRELIRRYGEDTTHLPEYKKNGIILQ